MQNYGKYNLVCHNCLDYVQFLLRNGKNNSMQIQRFIKNDSTITPILYYYKLNMAIKIKTFKTKAYKKVKKFFKKIVNIFPRVKKLI